MDDTKKYNFRTFNKDFLSSIVVFLVAIPLCLGVAIASGASPTAGLISGIIGGVVVGYFSGCSLQVSGPAAGLVAMVWEIVNNQGMEYLGAIVFAAGILQIIFGYLKLGLWFRAVTPAVIYGMLSGIGFIILCSQFHVMVDDIPRSNSIENLISIPESILKGISPTENTSHHLAALIGIITIGIIILWELLPKKIKMIPAPLIAIIISSSISYYFNCDIKYVTVPENIFGDLHFLSISSLKHLLNWEATISVLALAFIASAETLLTATAVSQMKPGLKTHYNKETIAQGIGNTLAGLVGALPVSGVIVRSAANVQAGGMTRVSTILHGSLILIFTLAFPFLLEKIPICSLAAVLVYTGYKLLNLKVIKELVKFGRFEVAIFFATIIGIVSISLLEGILIGLVLSFGKLIYKLAYIEISEIRDESNKIIHVSMKGNATFINLPKISQAFEELTPGYSINVHIKELDYIDHACIEFLVGLDKSTSKVTIDWDELMSYTKKQLNSKAV